MIFFKKRYIVGTQEGKHGVDIQCFSLWSLTSVLLTLAEFSGVLHHCHILASEMVHFIHQMQYYITFEVHLSHSLILESSDP